MKHTWLIIVAGLSAAILHAWVPRDALGAPGTTPAESDGVKTQLFELLRQEGLGPENRYLQGHFISHLPKSSGLPVYPAAGFPYRWDFEDGTLCGINEHWLMEQVGVDRGMLHARVAGSNAFLAWGDFDGKSLPLHWGYPDTNGYTMPGLAGITVRLRQSLTQSVMRAGVRMAQVGRVSRTARGRDIFSEPVAVTGTNWQEVTIGKFGWRPTPPYSGFRLHFDTPGNDLAIDRVLPLAYDQTLCYRRVIMIPAPVRWARCSIVSESFHRLYVNGKPAASSPPETRCRQIWNYELDPDLFHKGENVLAEENSHWFGGGFILDGALLCTDGSYLRFDSDSAWRAPPDAGISGADWRLPGFDDSTWLPAPAATNHPNAPSVYANLVRPQSDAGGASYQCFWFNPSWKGQLMIAPADGRSQPVYGHREDVALRAAVAARDGANHEITWRVLDEMGDGFRAADREITAGRLQLEREALSGNMGADMAGNLVFPAGTLPANTAYAAVLTLAINGVNVETCRFEFVIAGPVAQPVVANPTNYTDGMNLKLVWELDAAEEPRPGEFISCSGDAQEKPSAVVETPLGRFRETYGGGEGAKGDDPNSPCMFLSFVYRLANPGRPHLAAAEYPEDSRRVQEMRINENAFWGAMTTLGNDTAVMGVEQPLSHEIRRHQCVFFPNQSTGTISIFAMQAGKKWRKEMAGRVGKMRIYEILNDLPMRKIEDAPGPRKWIGQQPEAGPRQVMQSCFNSPLAPLIRGSLSHSERPNFYRSWLLTYMNMVKRMRFAGENSINYGQFMYDQVLYPSAYADHTAFESGYSGSLKDSGVLMAKLLEENGMGWFSSIEMMAHTRMKLTASDAEAARGAETFAAVGRDGRQYLWRGNVYPNWLHPAARGHFETVINELIALYGKWPGWKGITLQVNEELGPCWVTFDGADPYFASYDDYTISLFERETGIKIPVPADDLERFAKRYDWLMANARAEWTDWRCEKMTEIYDWVKNRLRETRPDLKLVLFTNGNSFINPPLDDPSPPPSLLDYARRGGLDLKRFVQDPDVTVCHTVNVDREFQAIMAGRIGNEINGRFAAHRDDFLEELSYDGQNGVAVRCNWFEPQPRAPANWPWWHRSCNAEAWPYPSAEYFGDYWCNILVRSNPALVIHSLQDLTMWMGRELDMARYAAAFRSIPAGHYQRLRGQGRDVNIWISMTEHDGDVYGYIANPHWWSVQAALLMPAAARGMDLLTGLPIAGATWKIDLAPYAIRPFRIGGAAPQTAVLSCSAAIDPRGITATENMLEELRKSLETDERAAREDGGPMLEELERSGYLRLGQSMAERARQGIAAGDFGAAYELLTASADSLRFGRLRQQAGFILNGLPTAAANVKAGNAALSRGEHAAALRYFRHAARLNSVEGRLGAARVHLALNHPDAAEAEYRTALAAPDINPNHQCEAMAELIAIARDHRRDRQLAERLAEEYLDAVGKALADDRLHDHAKTILIYQAGLACQTGFKGLRPRDPAAAGRWYARVDQVQRPHPGYWLFIYNQWQECALMMKDYPETRRLGDILLNTREISGHVLRSDNTRAMALYRRGQAWRAEDRIDRARADFDAALATPGISDELKTRIKKELASDATGK